MVLLAPVSGGNGVSKLHIIAAERAICRFRVVACGPEVRDISEGQIVLANRLAVTKIGEQFLLPEGSILGTLDGAPHAYTDFVEREVAARGKP